MQQENHTLPLKYQGRVLQRDLESVVKWRTFTSHEDGRMAKSGHLGNPGLRTLALRSATRTARLKKIIRPHVGILTLGVGSHLRVAIPRVSADSCAAQPRCSLAEIARLAVLPIQCCISQQSPACETRPPATDVGGG